MNVMKIKEITAHRALRTVSGIRPYSFKTIFIHCILTYVNDIFYVCFFPLKGLCHREAKKSLTQGKYTSMFHILYMLHILYILKHIHYMYFKGIHILIVIR